MKDELNFINCNNDIIIDYNSEDFEEHLDKIRDSLYKNNKEFIKINKEINYILNSNENILKIILDEDVNTPLSANDCKILSQLHLKFLKAHRIIEEVMYCRGNIDLYTKLKELKKLKDS